MKNALVSKKLSLWPANRAVILGLALSLSACVSQTPKLDSNFGNSLDRSKQVQRIEPTSAQRRTPAPPVTSAEVQRAVTTQTTGIPGMATTPGMQPGMGTSGFGTSQAPTAVSTPSSNTRW